jgi:Fe-S oxidoreductase
VIGIAAVQLLRALGCDVTIAGGCCQRPRISHGYLEKAMEEGEELFRRLDTGEDTPILVCEPGCASALTDDLPDLVDDEELARRITRRVIPIEQWLQGKTEQNLTAKLTPSAKEIFLHGHCHQKALYGTTAIHHIFNMLGATIYEPDSGCCGMAGSFGYEKEHYEISQQMGERVLFKELRERPDMLVVAAGFSCRHQIEHFTGRTVKHWLNAIELK